MTSLLDIITNRDEYTAVSPAMPSGWLPIRRKRDGQLFVGQRLRPIKTQQQPNNPQQQNDGQQRIDIHALLTTGYLDNAGAGNGAGDGAAADGHPEEGEVFYETLQRLLRHDNLVSIEAFTAITVPLLAGRNSEVPILVWDLCEAGTLAALIDDLPLMARTGVYGGRVGSLLQGTTFLPESLCWHVVRGVLRALAWLHDGYATVDAVLDADGEVVLPQPQDDWMTIVHRAVSTEHIFFQHPRGSETYGRCKLGGYGECLVSGLVSGLVDGPQVRTSLSAPPPAHMMQGNADGLGRDIFCTRGRDLGGLGEMLHHMMVGQPWMTAAEKDDEQNCVRRRRELLAELEDEDEADLDGEDSDADADADADANGEVGYTYGLRKFRRNLLRYTDGHNYTGGKEVALTLFDEAERGYLLWRRNTADGRQYVDVSDAWVKAEE